MQDEYRLPDVYRGYRAGGDQRAALHGEQRLRRRGYLRQRGVSVGRGLRQRTMPRQVRTVHAVGTENLWQVHETHKSTHPVGVTV